MGPLNGIKILGFTHFAQAPFALQTLGDLGTGGNDYVRE